ncbi:response regulator transcription factor [Azospirillum rugosum]|uniref:FixJ family two-component response regulator n=1 Tax=Azospirillum rugosum TaxID=416170 RepID=A0ABS4SXN4_9PROT|nr:response regulator [Azospirillum rugosum]MBP2297318.1 FixJ family two-component response regulator [Azospirillum rugosum]MDQ0530664.1 FixJ family two-component response regulator [Azospirillum rugosum]
MAVKDRFDDHRFDDGGTPMVLVLDDDAAVRGALDSLFRSVGFAAATFAAPEELMAFDPPMVPCCLVLDIRLKEANGLDVQARLALSDSPIPVVLMTGHGDIPMAVTGMKAGAIDFLVKPFREHDMLAAVNAAIAADRHRRRREHMREHLRSAFRTLTAREREVMGFVTAGLMNKQIAGHMNLSEITVKIHRGNVMRKMGAQTLPDLVRMAEALSVRPEAVGRQQAACA